MTTATLDALKQLAVVRAVVETAKGFAALGDFDFWAAAQHFASAGLWGTVAGMQVASMAGAFSGGGRSAGLQPGSAVLKGDATTAALPTTLAPGAVGAGPPAGNLTVMVVGEPGQGSGWPRS